VRGCVAVGPLRSSDVTSARGKDRKGVVHEKSSDCMPASGCRDHRCNERWRKRRGRSLFHVLVIGLSRGFWPIWLTKNTWKLIQGKWNTREGTLSFSRLKHHSPSSSWESWATSLYTHSGEKEGPKKKEGRLVSQAEKGPSEAFDNKSIWGKKGSFGRQRGRAVTCKCSCRGSPGTGDHQARKKEGERFRAAAGTPTNITCIRDSGLASKRMIDFQRSPRVSGSNNVWLSLMARRWCRDLGFFPFLSRHVKRGGEGVIRHPFSLEVTGGSVPLSNSMKGGKEGRGNSSLRNAPGPVF